MSVLVRGSNQLVRPPILNLLASPGVASDLHHVLCMACK